MEIKIPPHSEECETAILSAVLKDPNNFEKLKEFSSSDIFIDGHREIYDFLRGAYLSDATKEDILREIIHEKDILTFIVAEYFDYLENKHKDNINLDAYASIVRERSILRELIDKGDEIEINKYKDTTDTLLGTLELFLKELKIRMEK